MATIPTEMMAEPIRISARNEPLFFLNWFFIFLLLTGLTGRCQDSGAVESFRSACLNYTYIPNNVNKYFAIYLAIIP